MENKLKPCPFCGNAAELYTIYEACENVASKKSEIPKNAKLVCEKKVPNKPKYFIYKKMRYIPRCTISSCMGRTSKWFLSEEVAVASWNTRTEVKDDE